jgi:hypothetical protein
MINIFVPSYLNNINVGHTESQWENAWIEANYPKRAGYLIVRMSNKEIQDNPSRLVFI